MNFSHYQQSAHQTSFNTLVGHPIVYPTLGLANEAGEFAGKVKKLFRDHNAEMTPDLELKFKHELGDILWYAAEICSAMGWDLNEVAELNLEKVFARQLNNKTHGEGDER